MTKFHVNPETGDAGPCGAKKSCPFGGADEHYDTVQEAYAASEKQLVNEYGTTAPVGKTKEEAASRTTDPVFTESETQTISDYIHYGDYGVRMMDKGFSTPASGSNTFKGYRIEDVEVSHSGDVTVYLDPTEEGLDNENTGLDVHMTENDLYDLSEDEVRSRAQEIADTVNNEYTDNVVDNDFFEANGAADELREYYEEQSDDFGHVAEKVKVLPRGVARNVSEQSVMHMWESEQDD